MPKEKESDSKLRLFIEDLPELIIEFKGFIITFIIWIIIAEIAGYSLINLIRTFIRLILYPLNLILFNMDFTDALVPEIFILLMPLVILTAVSFFIIISTED